MSAEQFDVAVVGASIAGCTAATLFARQGLRVGLLERNESADAYRKLCTHFIQPSATDTIRRLGLAALIEAAGGVRNGADIWTPHGAVPATMALGRYGYNITRARLDPMLRKLAAETKNVELMLGHSVTAVTTEAGRVTGVVADDRSTGKMRELRARLVVGADGRGSKVGMLAGVPGASSPHGRFLYFAYYKNIHLPTGDASQLWFCDPDVAYAFPNEDGLCCVAAAVDKEKLPAWREDLEGRFLQHIESLPRAPDIRSAERVSAFVGMIDMPNHTRPAFAPGIAFVGDAATTSDPVWGVGCGWAFQSAEWLADEAGEALTGRGDLDAALGRYQTIHDARIGAHHTIIAEQSSGRRFNAMERFLLSAVSRDEALARRFQAIVSRIDEPKQFFTLGTLARALWVNLSRKTPITHTDRSRRTR